MIKTIVYPVALLKFIKGMFLWEYLFHRQMMWERVMVEIKKLERDSSILFFYRSNAIDADILKDIMQTRRTAVKQNK